MIVGLPGEQAVGEHRVALLPEAAAALIKAGFEVLVAHGAGLGVMTDDADYVQAGAVVTDREDVLARADVVLWVQPGDAELSSLGRGQVGIGFLDPLRQAERLAGAAATGAIWLALELVPRTTKAQRADALSAMATLAGYKAVLLAASHLPRVFPLLMTAAGTLLPARVFVLGAGVAGLQAIATAKRLGAKVSAFDVRPEAREQVASVGGRFIELPLEGAAGEGGYARAMDETYYRRQRELLAEVLQASEVAITTAQVPDGPAPLLLTHAMMAAMPKGSVVVDLAANQGGNCEGVLPDQTVMVGATTLVGAGNLPGTIAVHASQMLGRNMQAILTFLAPRNQLALDDEVIQAMVVTRDGAVVHRGVAQRLRVQPADDNTAGEERP